MKLKNHFLKLNLICNQTIFEDRSQLAAWGKHVVDKVELMPWSNNELSMYK